MKKTILNGLILFTCTGFLSANEYSVNKKFKPQKIIVAQILEPAEEVFEAEIIDSMEIGSKNESFSEWEDENFASKQTITKKNVTMSKNAKILVEKVKELEIDGNEKKTDKEWRNLARKLKEIDPRKRGFTGLRIALYNIMHDSSLEEEKEVYHQLGKACDRLYKKIKKESKKRLNDGEIVRERSSKKRRLDPEGVVSKPIQSSLEEKEEQKEGMDTEIVPTEEIDLRKPIIKRESPVMLKANNELIQQVSALKINGNEKKTDDEWRNLARKLKEKYFKKRSYNALKCALYAIAQNPTLEEEQEIYLQLGRACGRIQTQINRENNKRPNDGEIVQQRSSKKKRFDSEVIVSKPKESPMEEKEAFGVELLSGSKHFLSNQDMGLNNNSNMELASETQSNASSRIELEKEMSDNDELDYMDIIQYMELNPSVETDEQEEDMDTEIVLPTEKNSFQDRVPPTFFESAEEIALQGPYKDLVEILRGYPINNIKEKNNLYWENLVVEIKEKDAQQRTFGTLRNIFFWLQKNLSANDEKEICHQLSKACRRINDDINRQNKKRSNDGEIVQEHLSNFPERLRTEPFSNWIWVPMNEAKSIKENGILKD